MNDINNNVNNDISLFQIQAKSVNDSSVNINNNINDFYLEEFKLFFKKYIANQRRKQNVNNDDAFSDSESVESFNEIYNELNNIYLKCYQNLNQFLKVDNNLKGVRLEGNKLLENISLEQFNELFSEYGKGIEKKLKKQVLNYFYPNNNKPKLMGQKMHLTPIPIKKQMYLKNQAEKNNYKNAERAAVIMRRLEYTHGLGNKKQNEEKIFFYLIKGAALIIEDWWISIMKKRGNYNIGNLNNNINSNLEYYNNNNNIESNNIFNNDEYNNKRQNKYTFQMRPKSSARTINYSLYNDYNIENNNNKNNYNMNQNKNNRIKLISPKNKKKKK